MGPHCRRESEAQAQLSCRAGTWASSCRVAPWEERRKGAEEQRHTWVEACLRQACSSQQRLRQKKRLLPLDPPYLENQA
jgi:hypothetical protein